MTSEAKDATMRIQETGMRGTVKGNQSLPRVGWWGTDGTQGELMSTLEETSSLDKSFIQYAR